MGEAVSRQFLGSQVAMAPCGGAQKLHTSVVLAALGPAQSRPAAPTDARARPGAEQLPNALGRAVHRREHHRRRSQLAAVLLNVCAVPNEQLRADRVPPFACSTQQQAAQLPLL